MLKGDPQDIKTLNDVLKLQLIAINQFFLHARMAKNWGLSKLNEKVYGQSITAMKLADDLIERVLFLEGLPNLQDLGRLMIGEDVPEILQCDLQLQIRSRETQQNAIAHCEESRDYVSRDLLAHILEETEEHVDWIEAQQWLIDRSGLKNYLQSQM